MKKVLVVLVCLLLVMGVQPFWNNAVALPSNKPIRYVNLRARGYVVVDGEMQPQNRIHVAMWVHYFDFDLGLWQNILGFDWTNSNGWYVVTVSDIPVYGSEDQEYNATVRVKAYPDWTFHPYACGMVTSGPWTLDHNTQHDPQAAYVTRKASGVCGNLIDNVDWSFGELAILDCQAYSLDINGDGVGGTVEDLQIQARWMNTPDAGNEMIAWDTLETHTLFRQAGRLL